ncbi:unnamed protein product [Knipowitschia caucasica]
MTDSGALVTVQKIYYPLLCSVGVPANLFTFYMICFHKCGMSKSAMVYLSCLAIVDTFYCVWVILVDLTLTFWLVRPFWHSHPWCNILGFLQYGALYSSSWIVVVFTIERYLVLRSTRAKQHFSKSSLTKIMCVGIVLASHLVSVPLGWINFVSTGNYTPTDGTNGSLPRCRYRDATYTTVIVWITTFLSGGVPIVLVIIFNYLIGYHLSRANNLFTKEERRVMQGRSRGVLRRTLLLLGTVSVAFVVLSLPRFVTYCILRTMHNEEDFDRDDYSLPINVAGDVANMLQNLNSTTNFLLYCMVSRRFRREIVRALTCSADAPRVSATYSQSTMKVFSVTERRAPPTGGARHCNS